MIRTITIFIIFGLFLPILSPVVFAEDESTKIKTPETIEDVQQLGSKALEVGEKELPGILQKIWQEEVLPIWQKMYDWFKANVWPKIESWIKPEIEKRKPLLEKEFEKEKEEVKKELPEVSKSLWEKFRDLIK